MGSAENFCLRWNDFQSSVSGAFGQLRKDADFFDVTLSCDSAGGRGDRAAPLRAHRVVLSACSPLFKQMLRDATSACPSHPNALLYLRGVGRRDLEYILDFMYNGEVNVSQNDLNRFLSVAEDLQVRGLAQGKGGGNGSMNHAKSSKGSAQSSSRAGPASKKRKLQNKSAEDDSYLDDSTSGVKDEPEGNVFVESGGGADGEFGDGEEDYEYDENYDYEDGGGGGGEDFVAEGDMENANGKGIGVVAFFLLRSIQIESLSIVFEW
jgi:hypothetical protein